MTDRDTTLPVGDSVAKVDAEVAVGEDLAFQHRWWRFERGIWVFFVCIILLDLAGVFGRGPVAIAHLRSADGSLQVKYERIERTGTPSMLTVSIGEQALRGGSVDLFVSDNVVGALGAQRVIPQPARTVVGNGGLTYSFPASVAPALIRIELQPAGPGLVALEVGLPGVAPLRARVLVVP
jgi:hypothetical protein